MTNAVIDSKVVEIEMLEAQIKNLKATVDSLKGDLKRELDELNVEMLDTGINKIWYNVYAKKTVDTEALKQAGLYDKYTKDSTVIQFRITKSK